MDAYSLTRNGGPDERQTLSLQKDGDRYLVMNTSKEALETAPGYVYDKSKGVWVPATKQPI